MSSVLLLLRGTPGDRISQALPVLAYAVVTALALTVAGGAEFFFGLRARPDLAELGLFYTALASVAVALLTVPLLTLSASAVRLSTRRRDTRLSSLRLVGAPARLLHRLAVVEAAGLATMGAVLGVLAHLVLAPVFGLLTFAGTRLGAAQIVPPLWLGAGVVGIVVATAALAALWGLRRVAITPLGVRTREQVPMSRARQALLGVGLFLVLYQVGQRLPQLGGVAMTIASAVGAFAVGMAAMSLIGPPVLTALARRRHRRARTAEQLLAARTLLEDPRAAWRQVQGVALVSFVSVVVGIGLALMGDAPAGPGGRDDLVLRDLRVGVLLTIGLAYLTAAATVAVHAGAEVLDRRQLYVALDRLGMPRATIERSRTATVVGPVVTVTVLGALAGGVLTLPFAGIALVVDPTTLVAVGLALAVGVVVVWTAVRLTRPLLLQVLRGAEPVV